MTRRLCFFVLFFLLACRAFPTLADTPAAGTNAELAAADQLYRSGKFAEAAEKYQALLSTDSTLVAAQTGRIRSWLREDKVDAAFAAATSDMATQPNSAPLLAAMGDVQFRRAEMAEAETSYRRAVSVDPKNVQAHLGLWRLYRSYSLYRHAYDEQSLPLRFEGKPSLG